VHTLIWPTEAIISGPKDYSAARQLDTKENIRCTVSDNASRIFRCRRLYVSGEEIIILLIHTTNISSEIIKGHPNVSDDEVLGNRHATYNYRWKVPHSSFSRGSETEMTNMTGVVGVAKVKQVEVLLERLEKNKLGKDGILPQLLASR